MSELPRAAIAVTSGKGGVGKSTVSLNIALALAERSSAVGLLDADFYGPDIPLMVGLKRSALGERWLLARRGGLRLEPVERYGIKIMSVGFLIAEGQALALGAPLLRSALHQLVRDVDWGALDFLIVDLPPGTADLQQELFELVTFAGAIVVVGPQDVAHLDGKKVLDLLQKADVRVLGAVENMTSLMCPHCRSAIDVFPRVAHERSIWAEGVPKLGEIPLDPAVAELGDRGRPVVAADGGGAQAEAFRRVAERIVRALEAPSRG